MCLNSITLNLSYDKLEKDFVGIGYKAINIADASGRINYSKVKGHYHSGWNKATGSYNINENPVLSRIILSNRYQMYFPGFHIFLKKEDAAEYLSQYALVEVKFKGVVSFGTNNINNIRYGDCVIARHMKINKLISISGRRYLDSINNENTCYIRRN